MAHLFTTELLHVTGMFHDVLLGSKSWKLKRKLIETPDIFVLLMLPLCTQHNGFRWLQRAGTGGGGLS